MPCNAEISRTNPTCFLFLLDQSDSMKQPIGNGSGQSKAATLADAINRMLQTLVLRCSVGTDIFNRFCVGVIGYGGEQAAPALGGNLAGHPLVWVKDLGLHPLRVEKRSQRVPDGAGGIIEIEKLFPIWFDPISSGRTPMCAGLQQAAELLAGFLIQYPDCFPPVVMNFSDGAATDGDPTPFAETLRGLSSSDGNVLLFNAFLSSREIAAIEYPDRESLLPGDHARRLFRMSSVLPTKLLGGAAQLGLSVRDGARGFVFNADPVSMAQFLEIGTRHTGR